MKRMQITGCEIREGDRLSVGFLGYGDVFAEVVRVSDPRPGMLGVTNVDVTVSLEGRGHTTPCNVATLHTIERP